MATRAQVTELLDRGHSFQTASRQLGISPGLAFMIATGLPADGSGAPAPEELAGKRVPSGSSQQLVNPPAVKPARNDEVIKWVARRAARELRPPG